MKLFIKTVFSSVSNVVKNGLSSVPYLYSNITKLNWNMILLLKIKGISGPDEHHQLLMEDNELCNYNRSYLSGSS